MAFDCPTACQHKQPHSDAKNLIEIGNEKLYLDVSVVSNGSAKEDRTRGIAPSWAPDDSILLLEHTKKEATHAGFQRCGSISSIRLTGSEGKRSSTSFMETWGPLRLADWTMIHARECANRCASCPPMARSCGRWQADRSHFRFSCDR